MRRIDLSPARQKCLIKCESHPNCWALLPPPTPRRLPDELGLMQVLPGAMTALERLKTETAWLPNVDMVTRTMERREAVYSSQIEGTRTQLHELLEYEATQTLDGVPADATTTERYVHALELGLGALRHEDAPGAITNSLIKAMHAELMHDQPQHLPGEYRVLQAWIGANRIEDATFVPPPPGDVARCMDELEASMLMYSRRDDEQWTLHVIARTAIAHAQFETIHPFTDGNGRVGRLLIPLMLAEEGYPPLYVSGYLSRYRTAYFQALLQVQLRDEWTPWIILLVKAIEHSCDEAIAIARDLNAIAERWSSMLSGLRSDAAARKMPRFLLGHPVVSVRQVEAGLGISFVAANKAIEQLVSHGILREPKQKRNRVFHATELLDRLKRV